MKRSTALDTATAKGRRWLRLSAHRSEVDQLFDLYWGGKERRITKLTLRIIGVNILVLLTLLFGLIYLSQYQEKLIASKLEVFQTEIYLLSMTLGESAVSRERDHANSLDFKKVQDFVGVAGQTLDKRVLVFNAEGTLLADSQKIRPNEDIYSLYRMRNDEKPQLQSIEVLKEVGRILFSFLPKPGELPVFRGVVSDNAQDYSDVLDARREHSLSMTAWSDPEGGIVLTAALPIFDGRIMVGTIMLVSNGKDMRAAMGAAWFDIFKIFLFTLLMTILISIYLSGVIARPLKKLASAAERVRRGKANYLDIPDMSDRKDEIGELSLVLREMMQALWERMDATEAFAADVSHEIKNPLTSLKSAVETLSVVKKKEDQAKLLEIIRHDIERLDRLITDISGFSRLDAELSREQFTSVDLKALLRDLIDVYKDPLDRQQENLGHSDKVVKNGVNILLSLPAENCIVMGSEGRLHQVFQNILSNALSFSRVGKAIKVTAARKGHTVMVSIEDDGGGIPETKLMNVFDRFYSERPEHEHYGRHSGLGLSICKQIVQAHNGVIYAENIRSRSGKVTGARFVVILSVVNG